MTHDAAALVLSNIALCCTCPVHQLRLEAETCNVGAVQVRALIRAGASLDSQIAGGRARATSNWMCAGSTALHLACARGMPTVAAILLDAQAANPGERHETVAHADCVLA
jgi:hypothetical protein